MAAPVFQKSEVNLRWTSMKCPIMKKKSFLPMAAKSFAQNWIVRFFGNAGSSASMKRRQVPLEHGYHSVLGGLTVGDADKKIWMCEEITEKKR